MRVGVVCTDGVRFFLLPACHGIPKTKDCRAAATIGPRSVLARTTSFGLASSRCSPSPQAQIYDERYHHEPYVELDEIQTFYNGGPQLSKFSFSDLEVSSPSRQTPGQQLRFENFRSHPTGLRSKSITPLIEESKSSSTSINSSGSVPFFKRLRPAPSGKRLNSFWWNPTWLWTHTLLTFALLFLILLATTVALYVGAQRNHGLVKQDAKWRYAWVYGPTAFLVLVVALWRQVDHCCKILMPWHTMRGEAAEAKNSLLLDYISPIFVLGFWRAIRNRHWAVVCSSLGFLFLKLSIMFSTGLFVLEPTAIQVQDVRMFATSRLDATDFASQNVTSGAALTYYGMLAQKIPYPLGTLRGTVVETFSPVDTRYDSSPITSEVQGITASVRCEVARTGAIENRNLPWRGFDTPFFVANISTPDCDINDYIIGYGAGKAGFAKNTNQTYEGVWDYATCNDGADNTGFRPDQRDSSAPRKTKEGFSDRRLIISILDLTWSAPPGSQDEPFNLREPYLVNYTFTDSTVLICKPKLRSNRFKVTYPPSSLDPMTTEWSPGTSTDLGEGYTDADLTKATLLTFDDIVFGFTAPGFVLSMVDPMFITLSLLNGNSTLAPFMDPGLLKSSAEELITNVATQIAHKYISKPVTSAETFPGEALVTENRLHVSQLSTALMSFCFGVVAIMAIILNFIRPRNAVPMRPDAIGAMAAVVAASPAVKDRLTGLSDVGLDAVSKALSSDKYRTLADGNTFKIVPIKPQAGLDPRQYQTHIPLKPRQWWDPLIWGHANTAILIIMPLILIVALEVLQQTSNKHDGLVDLPSASNNRLLYTYVPALVMFFLAASFTALDFDFSILAPFVALKRGTPSDHTMMESFVDKIPPHAFWLAVKGKHFPHALSILAAFLSSFLVIIVSGLFSATTVPLIRDISLLQTDAFNYSMSTNRAGDNYAGVSTSVIELSNGTYVGFIYDEIAYPSVKYEGDADETNSTVTVQLTGIRSSLECSAVPESDLVLTTYSRGETTSWTNNEYYADSITYSIDTNLSTECWGDKAANQKALYSQAFLLPNETSQAYSGKASSLYWDQTTFLVEGNRTLNRTKTTNTVRGEAFMWNTTADVSRDGCPSFSITLANFSSSSYEDSEGITQYNVEGNVTLGLCHQVLEEVTANVTLLLPDVTIDPRNPPLVLEDRARRIEDPDKPGVTDWPFATNSLIQALRYGFQSSLGYVDGFIEALVIGKNGRPLSELAGPGNEQNLFNAANKLHRTYMAQAFNFKGRSEEPFPANANPRNSLTTRYPATLIEHSRQRLVQNRAPTLALEILLGLMAILAGAALTLGEVRRVLPHNPMSIAGIGTLLAESTMTTSEVFPCSAELSLGDTRRALQGWSFRLGWGGDGKNGKRWFGVGIADSSDSTHVL